MILGLLGAAGEEQRDGRVGIKKCTFGQVSAADRAIAHSGSANCPKRHACASFFAVLRGGSLMHDPDQARWLCTVTITVTRTNAASGRRRRGSMNPNLRWR